MSSIVFSRTARLGLSILFLTLAATGSPVRANRAASKPAPKADASDALARLTLAFEANDGHADARFGFVSRGSGPRVLLSPHEAVLSASANRDESLRMRFVGAVHPRPVAWKGNRAPFRVNHITGNDPARWRLGVTTYAQAGYRNVYPGIDAVYYGNQKQLEYDLIVHPGADPKAIALRFDGARKLSVDAGGDLVMELGGGIVRHRKPVVYQEMAGQRTIIEARYRVTSSNTVAFVVGDYDHTRTLVIDPVILLSGFLTGTAIRGVALDAAGALYLSGGVSTGETQVAGALQAIVMKIGAPDGSDYVTVLGRVDAANSADAIAIGADGSAYIAGRTNNNGVSSPVAAFPTTAGAFDRSENGGTDAFVAKLNGSGALVYSTFLGGEAFDAATAIAVDAAGSAHVTGTTTSFGYPEMTTASFATLLTGGQDAFVTKLNPSGSARVYSFFLGGSGSENGKGIAVDATGAAYVVGDTTSTNFFATLNAVDHSFGGVVDAFLTRVHPAGTGVTVSTYLGGTSADSATAVAVDPQGFVYVAGSTESTNFPATSGAFSTIHAGNRDAFVTKFTGPGTAVVYSTLIGGSAEDLAMSVAVDAAGAAHITGRTFSANYPTTSDAWPVQPNNGDALLSKLNPGGTSLIYSTLLGGSGLDVGRAVAVGSSGEVFVAGDTKSANFPAVGNWFSATHTGESAFVVKLGPDVTPPVLTLPASITVEATSAAGASVFYPVTISDDDILATLVCTPNSGTVFPLGSTTVTCTATDAAGHVTTGSLAVEVVDTTPPTLSNLPADFAIEAMGATGSPPSWPAPTAIDQVAGNLPVSCAPASGTLFPLGVTPVSCAATDGAGNTMPYTFTVTVRDTRAPVMTVQFPRADDALTSPVTFDVLVTDQVGVTSVQVQTSLGTVSLNRIEGGVQVGRWAGQVPVVIPLSSAVSAVVSASDGPNTTTQTVLVDNDGIDAVIDRARDSYGTILTAIHSSDFNDGITSGTILERGIFGLTLRKFGNPGISIEAGPGTGAPARFSLCGGSPKEVQLDPRERVFVTCVSGGSLNVKVWNAYPSIVIRKDLGAGWQLVGTLGTNQENTYGSPFTASPDNTEPIHVDLVFIAPDGTEELMGSFDVDPGESVDTKVIPSGTGQDDHIEFEALAGDVSVTIDGQTQTLAAGTTSEFVVTPPSARLDQTITFSAISAHTFGDAAFGVIALASSGLPVVVAAEPGSNCAVAGAVVTLTGAGACTLTASQPGDQHFNAAASVTRTFAIAKAAQSIAFGELPNRLYGDGPFSAIATSSAGLPVSFAASGACTAAGGTITLAGVNACTITASQGGDHNYLSAAPVSRTFYTFYAWTGVLEPLSAGSTVAKQGSTVPVKFRLTGASAGVTNLQARIFAEKADAGGEVELTSRGGEAGNVFRYDAASGQYIFNWDTRAQADGTWKIRIDLLDGNAARTAVVVLRK